MPKFVKKTYTKDSPADYNYANDLETRIGNAIDPIDTKTQNIPEDGSFNPKTVNGSAGAISDAWFTVIDGNYYYSNNGTSGGFPSNYGILRHATNGSRVSQFYSSTEGLWYRCFTSSSDRTFKKIV